MRSKFQSKNNFHHQRLSRPGILADCFKGYFNQIFAALSVVLALSLFVYYTVYVPSSINSINVEQVSSLSSSSSSQSNPARKGLYGASNYVLEINSEQDYKGLLCARQPLLAVYYASWCAHCRKFAPSFMQVAEKVNTTLTRLNKPNSPNLYPNITLIAVDCVRYRSICSENKLKGYPTIIAHYVDNVNNRFSKVLEGSKADLLGYLASNVFKRGELDDKELVAITIAEISSSAKDMYYLHNDTISYHNTDTSLLLNDMMTSYSFFLVNELPSTLSKAHLSIVYIINYILMHTLPYHEASTTKHSKQYDKAAIQVYAQMLSQVNDVLYKYSKHDNFPSNKVNTVLAQYVSNSKRKLSTSRIQGTRRLLRASSLSLRWKICGLHPNRARTTKDHEDASRGFTCGLWILFHYLTFQASTINSHISATDMKQMEVMFSNIAPNRNMSESNGTDNVLGRYGNSTSLTMSPALIQTLIHQYIDLFFRCAECRAHFLHYYQNGLFDGHNVTTFEALQGWLLRLHNFINMRIAYENTFILQNKNIHSTLLYHNILKDAFSNASVAEDKEPVIRRRIIQLSSTALWPSKEQCPKCYISNVADYNARFMKGDRGEGKKESNYEEDINEYIRNVLNVNELLKHVNILYTL